MRLALSLHESAQKPLRETRTIRSLRIDAAEVNVELKHGTKIRYPLNKVLYLWIESDANDPTWTCEFCGSIYSLLDGSARKIRSVHCAHESKPFTIRLAHEFGARKAST